MSFPIPIQPPEDGFDKLEKAFLRQIVIDLYREIPTVEEKFILIATHEMGYSIAVVAEMLNQQQTTISLKLRNVICNLQKNPKIKDMKKKVQSTI